MNKCTLVLFIVALASGLALAQSNALENELGPDSRYEMLVVKVLNQAEEGTNGSPPTVNIKVLKVGKIDAGLPHDNSPAVGATFDGVVWGPDYSTHESGNAWWEIPLAAPAAQSDWIVLMKMNDEGKWMLNGTHRESYRERSEMYGYYLRALKKANS